MTQSKPLYPVPRRAHTFGILLFLASLSMLFIASLIGYFVIRIFGAASPRGRALQLPPILWISTLVMVASSVTMARALRAIRAERRGDFRRALLFTTALAVTFVAIQAPALADMLRSHARLEPTGMRLYGLLFFLVLLHALHVVGGLVMLAVVLLNARRGRYDHEHHSSVANLNAYWHFLDGVWLVMFLSLWIVG
jgi:heme/copper-type cytochrome/quinol oxidase subunit 3